MKKLLKEFIGESKPEVHIHMKDGSVYANMKIEQLSESAFRAKSRKGPVHIIQYDEVKQVKYDGAKD